MNPGLIVRTTGQGELASENNSITGYDTFDGVRAYIYLEFDRKPENIRAMERDTVSEIIPSAGTGLA